MEGVIQSIRTTAHQALKYIVVPSFDEMIQGKAHDYPYLDKFEEVVNDPTVVLHSSGSTGKMKCLVRNPYLLPAGIPRAVYISHGCLATLDNDRNLPTPRGRRKHDFTLWNFEGGGQFYAPFPPYHVSLVTLLSKDCD